MYYKYFAESVVPIFVTCLVPVELKNNCFLYPCKRPQDTCLYWPFTHIHAGILETKVYSNYILGSKRHIIHESPHLRSSGSWEWPWSSALAHSGRTIKFMAAISNINGIVQPVTIHWPTTSVILQCSPSQSISACAFNMHCCIEPWTCRERCVANASLAKICIIQAQQTPRIFILVFIRLNKERRNVFFCLHFYAVFTVLLCV